MASSDSKQSYLFVVPWDIRSPGGVNHVVVNLFEQISRRGPYRPIVLTNNWRHPVPQELMLDGRLTILYRLRLPFDRSAPLKATLAFLYSLPSSLYRLLSLIKKYRVDVVNLHYPSLYAMYFVLLKKLRLYKGRLVLSFHGMDVHEASESNPTSKLLWCTVLRNTDAVVTCSDSLRDEVIGFYPGCNNHVFSIHNGIDPDDIARLRGKGSLPEELVGKKFMLNVGTFEHKKGQDILLKAFQRIADAFPDVMVVLAGAAGEMSESIRNAISSSALQDRVKMYENVPHRTILALMEAATIFVMPSRREPFGIAIIEAGVLSKAVVATDVGGIPEIITDNETGLLVPRDDEGRLAHCLEYLLDGPDERNRLGEQLRRRVLERFSWDKAYTSYMQVVRDASVGSDR